MRERGKESEREANFEIERDRERNEEKKAMHRINMVTQTRHIKARLTFGKFKIRDN